MLSDKTPIPPAPSASDGSKEKLPPSRVDTVHGGKLVESIETPEPMNNPECKHTWELDPTERS